MNRWILIIILLAAAAVLFLCVRRFYAIRKVQNMSVTEKLSRMNQITPPFGFEYKLTQDIFTSRLDAWQRNCGYSMLYDRHAPFFHMIFDCEPVYFNYKGTTWLIEFWKGQYGITSGCEAGIYKADRILSEYERDSAFFHSVSDEEMPVFSITLLKKNCPLLRQCAKHWWLTGFLVGHYSEPEELSMKIAITFPEEEMCRAFFHGLRDTGYLYDDIYMSGKAAALTFASPYTLQPTARRCCYHSWIQLKNRFLIFLYLKFTVPFTFTIDRLLFLYEFLPILFRRILKLRRIGRKGKRHGH